MGFVGQILIKLKKFVISLFFSVAPLMSSWEYPLGSDMQVATQWPVKRAPHLQGLCGMDVWKIFGAIYAMNLSVCYRYGISCSTEPHAPTWGPTNSHIKIFWLEHPQL